MKTEDLIKKYFIGDLRERVLEIFRKDIGFEDESQFGIIGLFPWSDTEYPQICADIHMTLVDCKLTQQEKYEAVIQIQREAGVEGDEFNEAYDCIKKLENKIRNGKD